MPRASASAEKKKNAAAAADVPSPEAAGHYARREQWLSQQEQTGSIQFLVIHNDASLEHAILLVVGVEDDVTRREVLRWPPRWPIK